MKKIERFRHEQAFTMIEIMLVVIMIGILTAMVVPNLTGRSHQAKVIAATTDIKSHLQTALDFYEMDSGLYPTTEQGLTALLEKPKIDPVPVFWNGPYLRSQEMPVDPWGRIYQYEYPGVNNPIGFDLLSLGPDGVQSDDDIYNWKTK